MRIAISGTHSVGKSTFVSDFQKSHPEYILETEPYRALRDKHNIYFADKATQQCNSLQLNYAIDRSKLYNKDDNVIFDRCMADYIPYSEYPAEFGDTDIDESFVTSLFPLIKKTINYLDIIVFVPMSDDYTIDLEDDGIRQTDTFYQEWVDKAFKRMYRDQLESIVDTSQQESPRIVEITGLREYRVQTLEKIIRSMNNE